MAYNPFDFFRRNQKILFAVLTVFIMIMFTLQTGAANDFFQWFPRWLGSRSSGDVMAVVNGRKVRSSDLYEVQKHRRLANQFMLEAANQASFKLATEINATKNKVTEANRPFFEKFLRDRQPFSPNDPQTRYVGLSIDLIARFMQQMPMAEMEKFLTNFRNQNIQQIRQTLQGIVTSNNPPKEDLDAARLAQILMGLDLAPFHQARFYFYEAPNQTDKDSLDFLLWKLKADQLGIKFTREDVEQLVDVEFEIFDTESRTRVLQALVDDKRGITADAIYSYLADEFRVRAAQQAVLGSSYIRANAPAPVSPDQTYNLFKEVTDGARWSIATLSVDSFINQVQGAPTGQEIQDIYRKGQNIEPDPTLSRPALKKPRELKIGWLEVTGKEPYYDAAAKEAVAKLETSVNASNLLVVPLAGGPLGQIAGLGIASVPDKLLLEEYSKYKTSETEKGSTWQSRSSSSTEASLARPENAAILVGNASFSPLTAVLIPQIRAERMDDTHRVAAQLPPLAGALLGGPASLSSAILVPLVCQEKYPAQVAPKPLPLSAVRSTLLESVRQNFQTEKLPKADLEKLMSATKDAVANNPNDKAKGRDEAKKILDTFVATRKLADLKQVGESKDFADQYSVSKDPNLERLLVRFAGPHAGLDNVEGFGRVFFYDLTTTGLNQQTKEVDSQRFFTPRTYPEPTIGRLSDQSQYLVWLTAEVPAATRRVEEVKDAIVLEWKRQKARAAAKVAAEELAAKVATLKPDPAVLEKSWPELARAYGPPALMPEMAGQPLQVIPGSSGGYDFGRYPWPRLIVKYPTLEMQKALMENRNKPYGTSLVLTDQPESAYYVAVLVNRAEKQPIDYANIVYAPIATGRDNPAGMQLPILFTDLARRADMQEALELLRSEFGYKDENPKVNEKQSKGE